MPQAVAMERRNVMESRSRPKWRAISACPRGLSPSATGGIFISRYAITMSGIKLVLLAQSAIRLKA